MDETGTIAAGKAIISDLAWSALLPSTGGTSTKTSPGEDVMASSVSGVAGWLQSASEVELANVEARMSWVRIWVLFGWAGDGLGEADGRLCFLKAGCFSSEDFR